MYSNVQKFITTNINWIMNRRTFQKMVPIAPLYRGCLSIVLADSTINLSVKSWKTWQELYKVSRFW